MSLDGDIEKEQSSSATDGTVKLSAEEARKLRNKLLTLTQLVKDQNEQIDKYEKDIKNLTNENHIKRINNTESNSVLIEETENKQMSETILDDSTITEEKDAKIDFNELNEKDDNILLEYNRLKAVLQTTEQESIDLLAKYNESKNEYNELKEIYDLKVSELTNLYMKYDEIKSLNMKNNEDIQTTNIDEENTERIHRDENINSRDLESLTNKSISDDQQTLRFENISENNNICNEVYIKQMCENVNIMLLKSTSVKEILNYVQSWLRRFNKDETLESLVCHNNLEYNLYKTQSLNNSNHISNNCNNIKTCDDSNSCIVSEDLNTISNTTYSDLSSQNKDNEENNELSNLSDNTIKIYKELLVFYPNLWKSYKEVLNCFSIPTDNKARQMAFINYSELNSQFITIVKSLTRSIFNADEISIELSDETQNFYINETTDTNIIDIPFKQITVITSCSDLIKIINNLLENIDKIDDAYSLRDNFKQLSGSVEDVEAIILKSCKALEKIYTSVESNTTYIKELEKKNRGFEKQLMELSDELKNTISLCSENKTTALTQTKKCIDIARLFKDAMEENDKLTEKIRSYEKHNLLLKEELQIQTTSSITQNNESQNDMLKDVSDSNVDTYVSDEKSQVSSESGKANLEHSDLMNTNNLLISKINLVKNQDDICLSSTDLIGNQIENDNMSEKSDIKNSHVKDLSTDFSLKSDMLSQSETDLVQDSNYNDINFSNEFPDKNTSVDITKDESEGENSSVNIVENDVEENQSSQEITNLTINSLVDETQILNMSKPSCEILENNEKDEIINEHKIELEKMAILLCESENKLKESTKLISTLEFISKDLEVSRAENQKNYENAQTYLNSLNDQITLNTTLSQNLEHSKINYTSIQTKSENLQIYIDKLETNKKMLQEQLDIYQSKAQVLEEANTDLNLKITNKTNEFNQLKDYVYTLKSEISSLKAVNLKVDTELNNINKQLELPETNILASKQDELVTVEIPTISIEHEIKAISEAAHKMVLDSCLNVDSNSMLNDFKILLQKTQRDIIKNYNEERYVYFPDKKQFYEVSRLPKEVDLKTSVCDYLKFELIKAFQLLSAAADMWFNGALVIDDNKSNSLIKAALSKPWSIYTNPEPMVLTQATKESEVTKFEIPSQSYDAVTKLANILSVEISEKEKLKHHIKILEKKLSLRNSQISKEKKNDSTDVVSPLSESNTVQILTRQLQLTREKLAEASLKSVISEQKEPTITDDTEVQYMKTLLLNAERNASPQLMPVLNAMNRFIDNRFGTQ